jgi:hypothetical protein
MICFLIMLGATSSFAALGSASPPIPAAASSIYLPVLVQTSYTIRLTSIGTPTWKPVDIHLFSADGGDIGDFRATIAALLPPPNHGPGGAPSQPHPPPYDTELAQGVSQLHFHEGGPFTVSEFSNGKAIYIVWMLVPNPGSTGSSPDFAAGPIIPKSILPIHFGGVTRRNGAIYDPALTDQDASPDALAGLDGASHIAVFVADNTSFGPPETDPVGSYDYQLTMTDNQGRGWSL